MFQNGRIPLWLVATVAGTGILVVVVSSFTVPTPILGLLYKSATLIISLY